jgi:hypothetical protein
MNLVFTLAHSFLSSVTGLSGPAERSVSAAQPEPRSVSRRPRLAPTWPLAAGGFLRGV